MIAAGELTPPRGLGALLGLSMLFDDHAREMVPVTPPGRMLGSQPPAWKIRRP